MNFNEELRKTLGKRIREARQNKALTQAEVAEGADIDEKHLGKIERGEKIPLSSTLYGVWKATGLDINQLFYEIQKLENTMNPEELFKDDQK